MDTVDGGVGLGLGAKEVHDMRTTEHQRACVRRRGVLKRRDEAGSAVTDGKERAVVYAARWVVDSLEVALAHDRVGLAEVDAGEVLGEGREDALQAAEEIDVKR